nr:HAUS augmin-like complex subunit 2 isoform X2 [Oryctolagus cuniculus]
MPATEDWIKKLWDMYSMEYYTVEILSISKKTDPCFVNFSRLQQITNIQAEISQKNLEIELLKLEKDTADIVHPLYLAQKCHTLQSMNNHLEAVLKEKRSLRQRLLKPMCQENLPLEAVYHRYMVHLLELAVTFIEKLETHLETIRNIPHLDANLKKMFPANTSGRTTEDGPSAWAPCHRVGDLEEAPSSWLQPDPTLTVVAFWGVNQQMEDSSVSPFLCNCTFQINKSLKVY